MSKKNPSNPQNGAAPAYKRSVRNILIHRPMQREFTMILLALFMISSLATAFVIHDTLREAAFGGGLHFGKINPFEVISEVRFQLIVRVTCILMVTLIITGLFAIFFLHRVAGPVYRFRKTFHHLAEGTLPSAIQLREGDFFQEAAEDINAVIDRLRGENEKLEMLKRQIREILSKNPSKDIAAPLEETLKNLSE